MDCAHDKTKKFSAFTWHICKFKSHNLPGFFTVLQLKQQLNLNPLTAVYLENKIPPAIGQRRHVGNHGRDVQVERGLVQIQRGLVHGPVCCYKAVVPHLQPRLRIRIRNLFGSGFNRVSVSGFNRVSGSRCGIQIRIQEGKNNPQNLETLCFEVLDVLFWVLKASSVL